MKKGLLISFEGPDGAGKSTQIKLLAARAAELGLAFTCTREPGGTPIGDAIRALLLDTRFKEMTPLSESFLYAAARAQLFAEELQPLLDQGTLVFCDRFLDSSLAYQAYGGGLDVEFVLDINLAAVRGRLPDKTFILDLPPEEGLARRAAFVGDRIEQKPLAFHRRVREGFLILADRFPERITVIDATLPEEQVFSLIWAKVAPLLCDPMI
jgi:dTMP kinase